MQIEERVSNLEKRVDKIESDDITFTTQTLIQYLEDKVVFTLSVENVRKKVRAEEIPALKRKGIKGERMLFSKVEIDKWLNNG